MIPDLKKHLPASRY